MSSEHSRARVSRSEPIAIRGRARAEYVPHLEGMLVPGDPDQWLAAHGDVLFRYALRRVRRRDVAEDLVQETLLAALGALERFDGRASERTWLVAILRHKIADHFRAASGPGIGSLPADQLADLFDAQGIWRGSVPAWRADPAWLAEQADFRRTFAGCVEALPETLATAYVLRELEAMDPEKICKTLEITPINLSVRLHRARMRLRECLQRKWFGQS